MAGSLLMLFDDIVSVLDDISLMTKMAAKKTAGVVGDDLALNANAITDSKSGAPVSADRELPVVWAVAVGSFINKLIIIPIALLLSVFLPMTIQPLLMLGGAFLCYEGIEKIFHKAHKDDQKENGIEVHETVSEKDRIKGAVKTDFILSAEIMVLTLGVVANSSLMVKILTLSAIGIGMTVFVYGLVALIVKADDFGFWLKKRGDESNKEWVSRCGLAIITTIPYFMRFLTIAGTAAMFLVGGGIFTHQPIIHNFVNEYIHNSMIMGILLDGFVGVLVGIVSYFLMKLISFCKGLKST